MTADAPTLAVGAVVLHDGQILLVKRLREPSAGRWSVPGGRVEAGETLAQALVREVLEETGLAVTAGELIGWVERRVGAHHFVILDFWATLVEPSANVPSAGDDAADARLVPLGELSSLELVAGLGEFLAEHGIA